MSDKQTIEACAQIAEKVGREYGYDSERAGAFGHLIAKAIRRLNTHSAEELMTDESALWVDGEFTRHTDIR